MAFRYTRPPATQHLLLGGLLLGAIYVGAQPGFARAWAAMVRAHSDLALMTVGPWLLHALVFWALALGFHHVDTHDRPAFIARHRIQRGRRRQPPLARVLRVLAINHLLWAPVMLVIIAALLRARGWTASPELPSVARLLFELIQMSVAAVLIFYATHRFLHRKWWMRRVHRVHHEFKTSSALASEYTHPLEYCIGNFGTLAGGIVLFGPSLASIYLFTVLSVVTFVIHHSGYALPWAPWPLPHDWHHYRVVEQFGTFGVLDRWLGTDGRFGELRDGDEV